MTLVKTIAIAFLFGACVANPPPVAPTPPPDPPVEATTTPSTSTGESCDKSADDCLAWDDQCDCTEYKVGAGDDDDSGATSGDDDDDDSGATSYGDDDDDSD